MIPRSHSSRGQKRGDRPTTKPVPSTSSTRGSPSPHGDDEIYEEITPSLNPPQSLYVNEAAGPAVGGFMIPAGAGTGDVTGTGGTTAGAGAV
mgnify:FL=1